MRTGLVRHHPQISKLDSAYVEYLTENICEDEPLEHDRFSDLSSSSCNDEEGNQMNEYIDETYQICSHSRNKDFWKLYGESIYDIDLENSGE
jgi:hypothetical protein